MPTYKCATQKLVKDLNWGGEGIGYVATQLCTIGYATSQLGAARKDGYTIETGYPDNRIVTEDNGVPVEIEKESSDRMIAIKLVSVNMGNVGYDINKILLFRNGDDCNSIDFVVKITTITQEGEGDYLILDPNDVQFVSAINSYPVSITRNGTAIQGPNAPVWNIKLSGTGSHTMVSSALIATYVGSYPAASDQNKQCKLPVYLDSHVISSIYATYSISDPEKINMIQLGYNNKSAEFAVGIKYHKGDDNYVHFLNPQSNVSVELTTNNNNISYTETLFHNDTDLYARGYQLNRLDDKTDNGNFGITYTPLDHYITQIGNYINNCLIDSVSTEIPVGTYERIGITVSFDRTTRRLYISKSSKDDYFDRIDYLTCFVQSRGDDYMKGEVNLNGDWQLMSGSNPTGDLSGAYYQVIELNPIPGKMDWGDSYNSYVSGGIKLDYQTSTKIVDKSVNQ